MTPTDLVLGALNARGCNPRSAGAGKWTSKCPAHDDRDPSLSIGVATDGRVLLRCHAGCTADAIVGSVGLKMSDLFVPAAPGPRADRKSKGPGRDTTYRVCDATGAVQALHVRTDWHDGSKAFSWKSPDGSLGLGGRPASTLPLYGTERLADIPPGSAVFLVEGEKARDALEAAGRFAVATVTGASGTPSADVLRLLIPFDVFLWPDHDAVGRAHMARCAASILAEGGRARWLSWPEAREHDDAADFLARGGTPEQIDSMLASATLAPTPTADAGDGDGSQLSDSCSAWRPFPVECLPEPVGRFVQEAAAALGCDPAYVAVPAFAVLAGCVGNRRRLVLKSSWRVPCVLWCAVVGQPGSMKSPALGQVAGPLQAHEATVVRAYRDECERCERDAAEGTHSARPEPPARLLLADTTVEAVAKLLVHNPLGLLLVRDELGGWFSSFGAYKSGRGGDCQAWLEMYDAGPLLVDRKGDAVPLSVPRAAISVTGGITPEVLRRVLAEGHVGDGLAPRFLLVDPPRARKRWTDAAVTESAERGWAALLVSLRALEVDSEDDGAPHPRDVSLSPEAKEAWIKWYDRHAERQNDAEGWEASLLSKIESTCARLTLVLHVARVAWGIAAVAPDSVDVETVEAGAKLADWFAAEGLRVRESLAASPEERELRAILEFLRGHDGRMTVRDFQRLGPRRYRRSAEVARAALDLLVIEGWGDWHPVPAGEAGGPPSEVLVLRIGGDGDTTGGRHKKPEVPSPSPLPGDADDSAESEVAA
jgi:hypothetical protein